MAYNPLPEILWVGPLLVPLIIRAGVGIALLVLLLKTTSLLRSTSSLARPRVLLAGAIYGALSFCVLTGFLTQYVSLVGISLSLFMITFGKKYAEVPQDSRLFYILLLTSFISLLLAGAGPLSLDSPL